MNIVTPQLLAEWTQLQPVSTLNDAMNTPFNAGCNLIVADRQDRVKDAPFQDLTYALIDTFRVPEDERLLLKKEMLNQAIKGFSGELQYAARIVLEDMTTLARKIKDDFDLTLRLQGKAYSCHDEPWHYDGAAERRVGVRYSGPMTQEVHNDDVVNLRGKNQECVVKENPRTLSLRYGDVWAHKGESLIPFKFSMKLKFLSKATMPAVHRKPAPNGQPGLLLVADYL